MVCESCMPYARDAEKLRVVRSVDDLAAQAGPAQPAPAQPAPPLASPLPESGHEEEVQQQQQQQQQQVLGAEGEGDAPLGEEEAAAARATEVEQLALELVGLKDKHGAESRLEACLLELDEQRRATLSVREQLVVARAELEEARTRTASS